VSQRRRSLFAKYFLSLFVAVAVPVGIGGIGDAWFGYRDQRARLDERLKTEAQFAARQIEGFVEGIRGELEWTVQLAWMDGQEEQRKLDATRLLRKVSAISSISLIDPSGTERVVVSRLGLNRLTPGIDRSQDEGVIAARADKVWYGPIFIKDGSEPFMVVAVAGNRAANGVAIADVNLKLIWDVVLNIKIGETGRAFVVDQSKRLIAHPDLSLVLRGSTKPAAVEALLSSISSAQNGSAIVEDLTSQAMVAAAAPVGKVNWTVVAGQPIKEAFAPIWQVLWRTLALIAAGALFALGLAYALAQRMTKPIRVLESGVRSIGAGQFDHTIKIATGDELEQLAVRINEMARELAASQEKSERISRLRRFLAPQVAELVESSGDNHLLTGQLREVIVIFADLRGFTAFAANADSEEIIAVLSEYYQALGTVITQFGATLTNFAGDGVMILVNAPLACADPADRALELAIALQARVQALIVAWASRGHHIGFGVGLAMGPATVGTVGYEGRTDYTAIGTVTNLAARLCGVASNRQILVDSKVVTEATGKIALRPLESMSLKGLGENVSVFAVAAEAIERAGAEPSEKQPAIRQSTR
jgi:adenylate cyclase